MNMLSYHLLHSLKPGCLRKVYQKHYSQLTPMNFAPRSWKVSNPGIERRMKIIKEDTVALDSQEYENVDVEDLESDFMHVGGMYNQHSSEIQDMKEKTKLQIVQHKYFKKEAKPNFLTWDEKEQIRYLHDLDSGEWSIQKLSESFPACESVIRKILKARWKPEDSSTVKRHDIRVQKNWQLLFQGKLEIEPNIKKHMVKFSSKRKMVIPSTPPLSTEKVVCDTSNFGHNKNSQFLNIIKSYTDKVAEKSRVEPISITNSTKNQDDVENMNYSVLKYSQTSPKGDSYVVDGSLPKKSDSHFTLSQYRKTFNTLPEERNVHTKTGIEEKILDSNRIQATQVSVHSKSSTSVVPIKTGELELQNINSKNYPDNIVIPQNKWIEGGTYKVGDCFYDDDGTFLYRVPGLT